MVHAAGWAPASTGSGLPLSPRALPSTGMGGVGVGGGVLLPQTPASLGLPFWLLPGEAGLGAHPGLTAHAEGGDACLFSRCSSGKGSSVCWNAPCTCPSASPSISPLRAVGVPHPCVPFTRPRLLYEVMSCCPWNFGGEAGACPKEILLPMRPQ